MTEIKFTPWQGDLPTTPMQTGQVIDVGDTTVPHPSGVGWVTTATTVSTVVRYQPSEGGTWWHCFAGFAYEGQGYLISRPDGGSHVYVGPCQNLMDADHLRALAQAFLDEYGISSDTIHLVRCPNEKCAYHGRAPMGTRSTYASGIRYVIPVLHPERDRWILDSILGLQTEGKILLCAIPEHYGGVSDVPGERDLKKFLAKLRSQNPDLETQIDHLGWEFLEPLLHGFRR